MPTPITEEERKRCVESHRNYHAECAKDGPYIVGSYSDPNKCWPCGYEARLAVVEQDLREHEVQAEADRQRLAKLEQERDLYKGCRDASEQVRRDTNERFVALAEITERQMDEKSTALEARLAAVEAERDHLRRAPGRLGEYMLAAIITFACAAATASPMPVSTPRQDYIVQERPVAIPKRVLVKRADGSTRQLSLLLGPYWDVYDARTRAWIGTDTTEEGAVGIVRVLVLGKHPKKLP